MTNHAHTGPLVDYSEAAAHYDAGRALGADTLERWHEAVSSVAGPVNGISVVDVGAGTGLFSAAWVEWGAGVRALRALGDADLGPLTLGLVAFRAATPSGGGRA